MSRYPTLKDFDLEVQPWKPDDPRIFDHMSRAMRLDCQWSGAIVVVTAKQLTKRKQRGEEVNEEQELRNPLLRCAFNRDYGACNIINADLFQRDPTAVGKQLRRTEMRLHQMVIACHNGVGMDLAKLRYLGVAHTLHSNTWNFIGSDGSWGPGWELELGADMDVLEWLCQRPQDTRMAKHLIKGLKIVNGVIEGKMVVRGIGFFRRDAEDTPSAVVRFHHEPTQQAPT